MHLQQMEKDPRRAKPESLKAQDSENDARILDCLRLYTALTSQLYQFQALLYERSLNLPRQIFRSFRSIQQLLETAFTTLQTYVSINEDFVEEKDRILREQIKLTENQMSSSQLKGLQEEEPKRKRVETDYIFRKEKRGVEEKGVGQVEILKGEIESLKNQLRKNDFQYEIEIKKYNIKYEEMMEDIRFYQQKMCLVDQYEETIEQLEVELRVMKEVKDRDEQLIRNMARKLKNYEVERNGRSRLLSPSKVNSSFMSPSLIRSQLSPKPYSKVS